jgi:hypothetical protein
VNTDAPQVRTATVVRAAVADAALIVLFVILGRKSHHEDGSFLAATFRVAAPFLIGATVGWLASRAWRAPLDLNTGIVVWLATIVVGMLLRNLAFDRGTALPFIIVAASFTLVFLVGWRALARTIARRAH